MSIIWNDNGRRLLRGWLYWDSHSVTQSTTRGSCIPASRGYGQWRVYGLRFYSSQTTEINQFKQLTYEETVTDASCILFCSRAAAEDLGKKAFMKSLQHYTPMSPNSIVIINLVWVWQHSKQVLVISLAHRSDKTLIILKQNFRLLWWYWCTFKRFKLCCGVKWLCSHTMVSMRKKYIF